MSKPEDAVSPAVDAEEPPLSVPQFWEPVWEFVVHGIVGTAIFLIVAAFAVMIDLLVRWLEEKHAVSGEIVQG